ncbi:NAD(P)-dependent oxidoreductase [Paenibacillus sp. 598K]|uniref:SDR family NAD(P)-dependent oxidoreductase n=1 Tax=Paenibacillus sp. 598K TaxID=1117987 RepID=UPI000FFADB8B|nr:SDR family oxidoreductase [Paenibacillus sp. 598K]GBF74339.1 NAD(P)-dependent oxidoreductase [Paenibacillus sp. 598K]
MAQLRDKIILITGAAGMLGAAAVHMFLERGAMVAACDARPMPDDGMPGADMAPRFLFVEADMTDETQIIRLMTIIQERFGRLDGLYHNVYVNRTALIVNQTLADWEDAVRGTLTSTFLMNKHAARQMKTNGGGAIVNTSSILGAVPVPENAAYGASKAAVEQLTRVAAVELAPWHIRVNAIVPGDFKSEERIASYTERQKEAIREQTLIGRSGLPDEVNELAAFLLSDAASYATGSMYPITGGFGL